MNDYGDNKFVLDSFFDAATLDHSRENLGKVYEGDNILIINKAYALIAHIYRDVKDKYGDIILKEILEPLLVIKTDPVSSWHAIEANAIAQSNIAANGKQMQYNFDNSMARLKNLKIEILGKLEASLFEIKIEVNGKENPKLKDFYSEYNVAKDLYNQGQYEKALQHARDIFQKELESSFNVDIKYFSNFEKGTIEYFFNGILKNISELRNNHFKTKTGRKDSKTKAIVKLSIEQLINIRNYLEIANQ